MSCSICLLHNDWVFLFESLGSSTKLDIKLCESYFLTNKFWLWKFLDETFSNTTPIKNYWTLNIYLSGAQQDGKKRCSSTPLKSHSRRKYCNDYWDINQRHCMSIAYMEECCERYWGSLTLSKTFSFIKMTKIIFFFTHSRLFLSNSVFFLQGCAS